MKEGIHPKFEKATIKCGCGNVMEVGSTKESMSVETCSKCHPFYTGSQNSKFQAVELKNSNKNMVLKTNFCTKSGRFKDLPFVYLLTGGVI